MALPFKIPLFGSGSQRPVKPSNAAAHPIVPTPERTMEGRTSSAAPHMPFPVLPDSAPAPIQRRDELHVGRVPGLEAEEQPVERVHAVGLHLTHGGRIIQQKMHGAVAEDYGAAGKLAQNLASRCATCVHFNREAAKPHIEAALARMKQNVVLDSSGRVRTMASRRAAWGALIQREDIVKVSGICNAISEVMAKHSDGALRAPWLVHPTGGCPAPAQLAGPGGEDLSRLYKEKSRPAHLKSSGATAYDTILQTAQGKKK